jgi:hypothetical protein
VSEWNKLPAKEIVGKTASSLRENGFEVVVVSGAKEAKEAALKLIPEKSEVFVMTSVTVDSIGLGKEIDTSGRYESVRGALNAMDGKTQGRAMRKLGASPDVSVGSVHAVTQSGKLLVASLTGSQLPAYTYGAGTVIFVVSTKKIVPGLDEAWDRLVQHVVPQESARARSAYGLPETFSTYPSKVLILNKEVQPGRIKIILMNEDAGF